MSVLTPKRLFLCALSALIATAAFASHPSPRTYARAAWDEQNRVIVLFGGRGNTDGATGVAHASEETWLFSGASWAQRFPATTPPARSAHTMTYDSDLGRVLMFGGRQETVDERSDPVFLNDLWAWQNDDWSRVDADSAQRPAARNNAGLAYDAKEDRLILYGGTALAADGFTPVNVFDTWEFDGTNWTRTITETPKINRPELVYNPITEAVYMIGASNADGAVQMFRYDDGTWTSLSPTKTPTCVVEGHMFFAPDRGRFFFIGGICGGLSTPGEELFEYDATANTWTKITIVPVNRGIGRAAVYDTSRGRIVLFGGSVFGSPAITASTSMLNDFRWTTTESFNDPGARSLHVFETDPARNSIWMYGGLFESGASPRNDFWGYRGRQWFIGTDSLDAPDNCEYPVGTVDTDRSRLIVACLGSGLWEWNGEEWDSIENLKPRPDERRFSAMVYDRRLKKTVLFGGFFGSNYRNDTWTWDGTKWTEVEIDDKNRPPRRSSMAMWYDPLLERTVLYAGIGRPNINSRVTRYEDMWAFDGTRWTKLEVPATPGIRFRPAVAVNPTTGKATLFGGLRAEKLDEDSFRQYYDNDTWEWDGSTQRWTKIEITGQRPPVRQNAGFAWDPSIGKMVLFGGYAKGFYLSDVWHWDGTQWTPDLEPITGKRRAVR